MPPRDLYDILTVDRRSSPDEIKKAFRRLARSHHPDLNPDDPQAEVRFKELQRAYDILSDPQRRAAYDRFGMRAFERGGGGPTMAAKNPSDVINDILKGFWRPPATERRPGEDLRYHLSVTLEEVAAGVHREVQIKRRMTCEPCRGTGSASPDGKRSCRRCSGLGEEHLAVGPLDIKRPCSRCDGTGYEIIDPCPRCDGRGRMEVEQAIKVRLPRGVDTGQRLKVKGKGNGGYRGGASGDLYVVVHQRAHPSLRRQGTELMTDVRVDAPLAEAGGEVEIPTLTGSATITLPPGAASGQMFRLKGQGLPAVSGHGRGDLHVRLIIRGQEAPEGDSLLDTVSRAAREGARTLRDRLQGVF